MYHILTPRFLTAICFGQPSCNIVEGSIVNQSGDWKYQLGPDNVGQQQEWFSQQFSETCQLPGTLDTNRMGWMTFYKVLKGPTSGLPVCINFPDFPLFSDSWKMSRFVTLIKIII